MKNQDLHTLVPFASHVTPLRCVTRRPSPGLCGPVSSSLCGQRCLPSPTPVSHVKMLSMVTTPQEACWATHLGGMIWNSRTLFLKTHMHTSAFASLLGINKYANKRLGGIITAKLETLALSRVRYLSKEAERPRTHNIIFPQAWD